MGLEQDIVEKIRLLPPDRQREVLDFVEFLERKSAPQSSPRRPPPELAGQLHIVGDIIAPAFDESDWNALQ